MPLPNHTTTELVRIISDKITKTPTGGREMGAIDEVINRHIEIVADEVAALIDLNPDQAEELQERIIWRLELLPPS